LCLQELHGMTRTARGAGIAKGMPNPGGSPASADERAASPDGAGVA
jgi:hypothetical protein